MVSAHEPGSSFELNLIPHFKNMDICTQIMPINFQQNHMVTRSIVIFWQAGLVLEQTSQKLTII